MPNPLHAIAHRRWCLSAGRALNPIALVPLRGPLTRWAALLAPVLLCWAVLIPAMPTPMLRGLYTLLTPWRAHLPQALATVTVTPGEVTLIEGDALDITAAV